MFHIKQNSITFIVSFWLLRRKDLNVFDVTFGNLKQTILQRISAHYTHVSSLNSAQLQAQTPELMGMLLCSEEGNLNSSISLPTC